MAPSGLKRLLEDCYAGDARAVLPERRERVWEGMNRDLRGGVDFR